MADVPKSIDDYARSEAARYLETCSLARNIDDHRRHHLASRKVSDESRSKLTTKRRLLESAVAELSAPEAPRDRRRRHLWQNILAAGGGITLIGVIVMAGFRVPADGDDSLGNAVYFLGLVPIGLFFMSWKKTDRSRANRLAADQQTLSIRSASAD